MTVMSDQLIPRGVVFLEKFTIAHVVKKFHAS